MPPYVVAALISVLVAAGCSLLAILAATRLGFLDRPGTEAHKQQQRAVPYGGGFAVAIGLAAGLLAVGTGILDKTWWTLLGCAGLLLCVGFYDDRSALTARCKLAIQGIIAAAAVIIADLRIDSLHHVLPYSGHVAAWIWLIAVTNAYNLIDHADGISGTVGIISAATLAVICLVAKDPAHAVPWMALAGALAGFLIWNRPPARLYLGDAGSMPLGFLLGAGALTVTVWHVDGSGSPLALLAPLLIVAIPLFDSFVVVVKRWRRGRPIMKGDRNHISHRLGRLGLGPWATMFTIGSLHLALAAGALQLLSATLTDAIATLVQSMGVLVAVVLLETMRDDGA